MKSKYVVILSVKTVKYILIDYALLNNPNVLIIFIFLNNRDKIK